MANYICAFCGVQYDTSGLAHRCAGVDVPAFSGHSSALRDLQKQVELLIDQVAELTKQVAALAKEDQQRDKHDMTRLADDVDDHLKDFYGVKK